jgi:hypothetical protein
MITHVDGPLRTVEGVRIWRVIARGAPQYTRSFPEWFDEKDVRRRLATEGVEDLIAVEKVT